MVVPERSRPLMPDYGIATDEAGLLAWTDIEGKLLAARNYWITTVRPTGLPHAAPIWGVWWDGGLIFGVAKSSVKGRNLNAQPACVVHLESGDDVVIVEGRAVILTDFSAFAPIDAAYAAKYGVDGLTTTSPGSAAILIARVAPAVVLAWHESDFPTSATRFVFPSL